MCRPSSWLPPPAPYATTSVWTHSRDNNLVAIDLIVEHIRTKLQQPDLCRVFPNFQVREGDAAGALGRRGRGGGQEREAEEGGRRGRQ